MTYMMLEVYLPLTTNFDRKKIANMIFRIIGLERENVKTKKSSKVEMAEKIKKIIEEELINDYPMDKVKKL